MLLEGVECSQEIAASKPHRALIPTPGTLSQPSSRSGARTCPCTAPPGMALPVLPLGDGSLSGQGSSQRRLPLVRTRCFCQVCVASQSLLKGTSAALAWMALPFVTGQTMGPAACHALSQLGRDRVESCECLFQACWQRVIHKNLFCSPISQLLL